MLIFTPKPKKDYVLINLLNGTFEITAKKRELRPFEQKILLRTTF
jgi:hypothetical protein